MTTRVLGSHRARPGRELPAEGRGLAAGDRSPRHCEQQLLHYEAGDKRGGGGGRAQRQVALDEASPEHGQCRPQKHPGGSRGCPFLLACPQ